MAKFSAELWKELREYYKWHGDKNPKPIKFVFNPYGDKMLLVHFTDSHGKKMSSLVLVYNMPANKLNVTECLSIATEYEEFIIEYYESGEYDGIRHDNEEYSEEY